MGFDKPDFSIAPQSTAFRADLINNLYMEHAPKPYYTHADILPKASVINGGGENAYLTFGAEGEDERRAEFLQAHPELRPAAMVATRTRELMMDMLGISRDKTPLEKIGSMTPESEKLTGREMNIVNDAFQAMSLPERAKLEAELRESAKHPGSATPLMDRFVSGEWSGELYAHALKRRALYLHICCTENK